MSQIKTQNCLICKKDCINKFCSYKCYWQSKKGIYPIHTNQEIKLQRMKFRRTIQKEVLKRDNYTCQICFKQGVDLQVDHIKSWKEYVKLRFDINNCRTLCSRCHYKITFNKNMPENIQKWGHNLGRAVA